MEPRVDHTFRNDGFDPIQQDIYHPLPYKILTDYECHDSGRLRILKRSNMLSLLLTEQRDMELGDDAVPTVLIDDFQQSLYTSCFVDSISASIALTEWKCPTPWAITFSKHPYIFRGELHSLDGLLMIKLLLRGYIREESLFIEGDLQ